MNITQLSEHLKDVPQDTLVGYAKNPTGVVPQFLALAEIQRRQELQTPQNQAPASTVAQDVLSRAAPQIPQMPPQMAQPPQMAALPENQPGVASLPTGMAQGMAGGGIVAFAEGGDAEDEDEDAEMARLFPQKSGINVEEVLAGIRGLAGKFPQSYDAEKAKAAAVSQRGSHPYEAIALDEAKKLGIDPRLVQHILYKETGNLRDPATARSHAGAYGPMQLMPGTAKELGVDINDPEQNTRGGVRYLAKMLNQFGDPTHAMAAYNAGPGRVSEMLRRGRGIESLPRETQGYVRMAQGGIAHFAEGGESNLGPTDRAILEALKNPSETFGKVKDFISNLGTTYYGAGQTPTVNATPEEIQAALSGKTLSARPVDSQQSTGIQALAPPTENERLLGRAALNQRDIAAGRLQGGNVPAGQPLATSAAPVGIPKAIPALSLAGTQNPETYGLSGNFLQAPEPTIPEAPVPKSKSDEYFEALAQDIQERAAKAKEEGDINKYLAIMQAGFGMMGGQSPYALTNIGKGAEQGISTYGALRKQTADELKDIGASRLGLAKYKAAEEGAAETRELNKAIREAGLSQKGSEFETEQARKREESKLKEEDRAFVRLEHRSKSIEDSVRSGYQKNPLYLVNPEKFEAEIQSKIRLLKQTDPLHIALAKRANVGEPINIPTSTGSWSIKPKQ